MISTKNFSTLPKRQKLKEICKSISVLDAIIAEDWLDRYYLYNSRWAKDEEFSQMNHGSFSILFTEDGCVINGMSHEHYPKDKTQLTLSLPKNYHEFIFGEPVNSIGTTFCIWTNEENVWHVGQISDFDDGSEDLLSIFDSKPESYIEWASEYYEDQFEVNENTLSVVIDIYNGKKLTKAMVLTINKGIKHWQQLKDDLKEINYSNDL